MREGAERVEGTQGPPDAVDGWIALEFFLEGAEKPVPDDEQAAIVAIDVARVLGVVHPVIGRRDEDPFVPPELADVLRVDPELVDQVDRPDGYDDGCRDTREIHGNVKDPAEQETRAGLSQGGREVVVLALVVGHMGRPENRPLVP